MQSLTGFTRKYAIMEELDGGFSSGSTPEAFVRLDSWEGRIQASVHVKGLKQGPFMYRLYLIFAQGDKLVPLLAGTMNVTYNGMQSGLEIDADTLKNNGVKPETVRYAAITAESNDRKWIPLFSSFEKSYKWDESIRQLLLKKEPQISSEVDDSITISSITDGSITDITDNSITDNKVDTEVESTGYPTPSLDGNEVQAAQESGQEPEDEDDEEKKMVSTETKEIVQPPLKQATLAGLQEKADMQQDSITVQTNNYNKAKAFPVEDSFMRCDVSKLEGLLQNNFERFVPFKRASRGYSWYRVSDLSKLSNIMYLSGVNVPVFANPKILVGLFKFKHVLAGLYRGGNGADYYVIGVPAKNERDNRPFETACRWVPLRDSDIRDMGGYWLVYVSLKTGEIVV